MAQSERDNSIVHLYQARRWPIRRIARELSVSRNTVRDTLREWAATRTGLPPASTAKVRVKIIAPWVPAIERLLARFPAITAQRVFEELKRIPDTSGRLFAGGRSVVKEAVRELRPVAPPEVVERFETAPGEQGQMDWSTPEIPFTGGAQKRKAFVMVLGYSRRMYLDFGYREDFFSLVRRHVEAFQYFGGIPHQILYDNMKTVVVRWEGEVPLFNPRFLLFATHYGFRPKACRPYRPQTKGKVERPNRTIKENFLNGREFLDDEHLRAEAREWLAAWDLRPHRSTGRFPRERFQEERPHLLPLPRRSYDTREVAYRLVSMEGLISWEGSHYSVPPGVVGQIVVVTAGEHELTVLAADDFRSLARHERRPKGRPEMVRLAEHAPRRRRDEAAGLVLLCDTFKSLGSCALEFLVGLQKHGRTLRHELRQILELRQDYGTDDLLAGLRHALKFQAFEATVVQRYLLRHAKPRSLEMLIAAAGHVGRRRERDRPRHIQRDAGEYQRLFDPESLNRPARPVTDDETEETHRDESSDRDEGPGASAPGGPEDDRGPG